MMKPALLTFLLLLSLTASHAANVLTHERAPLSATEELRLAHPAEFQYAIVREVTDSFRPAISLRLVNAQGSNSIVFKIFAGKILDAGPQSQAELDAAVQKMGNLYAPASMEKMTEIHPLKLSQTGSLGSYATFTDASLIHVVQPPPDQYRIITVGLIRVGSYLFTIRGGSNDKDSMDYHTMLAILNSLQVGPRPPEDTAQPQL